MDDNPDKMEIQRAFRLNDLMPQPTEASTSPERLLLGELADDKKTVSTIEGYISDIVSNDQSKLREVRAILSPKFERYSGTDYLIDDLGATVFSRDGGVALTRDNLIAVDPDQSTLLLSLAEEVSRASSQKKDIQESVAAVSLNISDIVSNDQSKLRRARATLSPKFERYSGTDYLVDDLGATVFSRDGTLSLTRDNLPKLDSSETGLLINLANKVSTAVQERTKSNEFSRDFNLYISDIVSNDQSKLRRARATLSPKFERYSGTDYLVDDLGATVFSRDGGVALAKGNIPEVTPEQKDILIEVLELIINPRLPTEARALIGKYLQSQSSVDLVRLQGLLVQSDTSFATQVGETVARFSEISRRTELKRAFYDSLFKELTIDKSIGLLAAFDEGGAEDIALVAELRGRALDIRRAKISQSFASSLARADRNFDQTLVVLETLEKSSDRDDRLYGQVLRGLQYKFELATYRDEVRKMIKFDTKPEEIYRYIDGLPIRPSLDSYDYIEFQAQLRAKISEFYLGIGKLTRLKAANSIRQSFATANPDLVLGRINDLADETEEDIAVKLQLVDLYRNFVAATKPEIFDERFRQSIAQSIEAKLKQKFVSPERGQNKEAFGYLRENFVRAIYPLIESLRDDPRTGKTVGRLLMSGQNGNGGLSPRLRFIQKLDQLEKQRPLTDTERAYIQSVELLTLFNPYLVAAATADFGVTSEFLKHHFDVLSRQTTDQLKDGDYVPLILVGTGPNGVAAVGELVRNNPELARQTLIVDSGEQPGGPFAIPRGPAWELNSANRRGIGGYAMPNPPGEAELKTVRAYGSPVARWYPGERLKGSNARAGSINTTVDYLPTPDDLSNSRYPTNEVLQTILALQVAMLTQKLALKTELIKEEPNPNSEEQGDKIATLRITNPDGSARTVRVRSDAVFVSNGLGEPTYGFKLEGSKAEQVLQQTAGSAKFPKISTTLEAFREFSDRTQEKRSPGQTLAIWGRGNSADTLIEFIGNLFQGENPLVRDVTKIYIVSEGDLSSRPRYALISDLKPRNGRGNLIEQINARVVDVDFAGSIGQPEDRQIVLLDSQGRVISDSEGRPISADSGIAATGFRPALDKIFASYLDGQSLRDEGEAAPLQPIVLPTNPEVAIAESFRADSNIILLGTASRSRFNSFEKLAQLPTEAREALLRNGAENAVAIGFRAPDTQSAVNIWLNFRIVTLEAAVPESKPRIPLPGLIEIGRQGSIDRTVSPMALQIPDNIDQEDLLLSPLLAYNLGNQFDLDSRFTGNIDFSLEYDQASEKFIVQFNGGDSQTISSDLAGALTGAISDEYFQRYALSLLAKRRRNPKLGLNVAFKAGKIDPGSTYVQAV